MPQVGAGLALVAAMRTWASAGSIFVCAQGLDNTLQRAFSPCYTAVRAHSHSPCRHATSAIPHPTYAAAKAHGWRVDFRVTPDWIRALVIIAGVAVLLTANAIEFKGKHRALEQAFPEHPEDDVMLRLARHQAFQAQMNEQLLHMIHTMLAAVLVALLWR